MGGEDAKEEYAWRTVGGGTTVVGGDISTVRAVGLVDERGEVVHRPPGGGRTAGRGSGAGGGRPDSSDCVESEGVVLSTSSMLSERREDGGGRPNPAATLLAPSRAESERWPLVFQVEDLDPFLTIVAVNESPGGDYLPLQYVVL